jgi:acetyltransferase-like isoleucine patch superfamily enzyme
MLRSVLRSIIGKVRPNASTDISLATLVGWYVRKGLAPLLRGFAWAPRFASVKFPIFVGSRVRISYSKQMKLEKGVSIGDNTRIMAFSERGITIGAGSTIRENAWIQCASSPANPGDSLVVGQGTYIGPGAIIGVGGAVVIGDNCQIGASFIVVAENHIVDENHPTAIAVNRKGIEIGSSCWIGHRVTILDGVRLGDGCTVGAGAVVTKSYPAGSVIGGVPARVLVSKPGTE